MLGFRNTMKLKLYGTLRITCNSKMKTTIGNLITLAEEGHFDVIIHGCNCFHAMGGGIAAEIARKYPVAEEVDRLTEHGSRDKLGHFSYAEVHKEGKSPFTIVNGYTQHRWSGSKDVFEYEAFETLLNRLVSFLYNVHEKQGRLVKVGLPKIGCGLARGDESRILSMVEKFAKDVSPWATVTVVSLSGQPVSRTV